MIDDYGNTQFEQDLLNDSDLMNLVMDETFAKNLYAALCNTSWGKDDCVFECSWRYAAGFVAFLRQKKGGLLETYADFYCSGWEGVIFQDIEVVLGNLGWSPIFHE